MDVFYFTGIVVFFGMTVALAMGCAKLRRVQ
jgi:hypothetical protein